MLILHELCGPRLFQINFQDMVGPACHSQTAVPLKKSLLVIDPTSLLLPFCSLLVHWWSTWSQTRGVEVGGMLGGGGGVIQLLRDETQLSPDPPLTPNFPLAATLILVVWRLISRGSFSGQADAVDAVGVDWRWP